MYNDLHVPAAVAVLAPIINCVQLFPQLYKTFITKKRKDLSLYSLLLILFASLLWLLHGYHNGLPAYHRRNDKYVGERLFDRVVFYL
jgi:uncharacterized protein with PQ loop repeat